MRRQLCLKLFSKIPNNVWSTNTTNSISSNPILSSSIVKTSGKPLYQQPFSQHSTLSHSQLWKFCGPNGVYGRIQNGVLPGPALARRFCSRPLFRGQSKFPVNGAIRVYWRRFFHSFDSQRRGWRSGLRQFTADGVVIGLIVANVAVFVLWRVASPEFMVKNFMISVDNFTSGRLHTLITSAFSHNEMWHLITNMVGLYFFGLSIGRTFGPEYLLKLYLSGAVVGSIFYLAYHGFIAPSFQHELWQLMICATYFQGASGAVNAILLLDIFLFPTKTLYLDFIIPVPAILLGIFIIGKDVLRILEGNTQISGSAHLGGATVAALAWARSRRGRFWRF
ncbi:RHOMBOID-like protein 12 [Striga hermonthica]|uniref:RHOMBOID-like protein 12 n=1 Tax=Striga hermonthica TaxID=68872 RepID=A0A9N7NN84_STRHE|nr:RHOMBOID-like protein 12 [Striga hermonthica]